MSTFIIILLAGGTMLLLAMFIGYVLGWANKAFHVPVDPRVERTLAALPGANCGGCGCVGCNDYAEAVVAGKLPPDKCTVGGASCAAALAAILGVELKQSWPRRPIVHCGARQSQRLQQREYRGERTCTAANLVAGVQGCAYGCLGFGDCVEACAFDAIHVVQGLAHVDYHACVGCGACEKACPRHLITQTAFKADRMLAIRCSNKDFGKHVKAVCQIGCIGCKACTRVGGELFGFKDNLPAINYDAYDPAEMTAPHAAAEKCPMKAIVYFGKPSPKDLAAVAQEEMPAVSAPQFETTVDKTDWRG